MAGVVVVFVAWIIEKRILILHVVVMILVEIIIIIIIIIVIIIIIIIVIIINVFVCSICDGRNSDDSRRWCLVDGQDLI